MEHTGARVPLTCLAQKNSPSHQRRLLGAARPARTGRCATSLPRDLPVQERADGVRVEARARLARAQALSSYLRCYGFAGSMTIRDATGLSFVSVSSSQARPTWQRRGRGPRADLRAPAARHSGCSADLPQQGERSRSRTAAAASFAETPADTRCGRRQGCCRRRSGRSSIAHSS